MLTSLTEGKRSVPESRPLSPSWESTERPPAPRQRQATAQVGTRGTQRRGRGTPLGEHPKGSPRTSRRKL